MIESLREGKEPKELKFAVELVKVAEVSDFLRMAECFRIGCQRRDKISFDNHTLSQSTLDTDQSAT